MSLPGIHPVEPAGIPEPGLRSEIVESVQSVLESLAAVETPLRTWQVSLGCGHHLIYEQHADLHAPRYGHHDLRVLYKPPPAGAGIMFCRSGT